MIAQRDVANPQHSADLCARIRRYEEADHADLEALWLAAGQRPFESADVKRLIASGGGAWVAELNGSEPLLLGAALWAHNGEMAFLWRLVVRQGYRGLGIGRTLVRATEESAARAGFDAIGLLVNAHNHNAVGLYISEGFEKRIGMEYWRKAIGRTGD